MNSRRIAPMHIAFFIFLVSNIGGALLPVGPPLFLGFLKGVPFWWPLQHCWRQWLITVAIVLLVFFVLDLSIFAQAERASHESDLTRWSCDGAHNFIFLLVHFGRAHRRPDGLARTAHGFDCAGILSGNAENEFAKPTILLLHRSRKSAGSFSAFSER